MNNYNALRLKETMQTEDYTARIFQNIDQQNYEFTLWQNQQIEYRNKEMQEKDALQLLEGLKTDIDMKQLLQGDLSENE